MRLSREDAKKLGVPVPAGKEKFGNRRVVVDGIKYASGKECNRHGELKLLEKTGAIEGLEVHPKFLFTINGKRVGHYTADFLYYEKGVLVVEDVKGGQATKTEAYRLRKRLMAALHGINVVET